jgi:RHS repeat-associated protein
VLLSEILRTVSEPVVEIQNQVLKQSVRIAGSTFSLHYRSDRVPGRRTALSVRIPLTGKKPRGVKKVLLELEVAGQRHRQEFPVQPDLSYTFTWDGNDAAGNPAPPPQPLRIRIGYVQRPFYPRPEMTRWYEQTRSAGANDARRIGLGGWTLTPHHTFDPHRNVLYMGNGTRRHARSERVASVAQPRSAAANGPVAAELAVLSSDGTKKFIFDGSGRHLQTLDAVWNVVLLHFQYDEAGRLASITDQSGDVTRIERNGEVRISSAAGVQARLTLTDDGYLSTITNPAGHVARCRYAAGGLLSELVDPEGNAYRFSYDEAGRLTRREEPAGGSTSYASRRGEGSLSVAVLTALGRESIFERERLASGGQIRRNACCGGKVIETRISRDGSRLTSHPDNTSVQTRLEGDTRFSETRTPSGLSRKLVRRRAGQNQSETIIEINGNVHRVTFDRTRRERIAVSPTGLQRISRLDERGRLIERKMPGRLPITYDYDPAGRLTRIAYGGETEGRVTTIGYDQAGRLREIVDPAKRTFRFEYDQAGQLVRQNLPGGRIVGFEYDKNGNRVSITPPDRPKHLFSRNAVNLISAVQPGSPGGEGAATRYDYDQENRLSQITLPDGTRIEQRYDAVGRLSAVTTPAGTIQIAHDPKSGEVSTITTPDGTSLTYSFDGFLIKGLSWSGAVKGEVVRKHDSDFRIAAIAVGGVEIPRRYSSDGQLLRVGDLEIHRDSATGRVAGTALQNVRTLQSYNGFGELESFRAWVADREVFAYSLQRDPLGRIRQKDETIDGKQHRYGYEYDAAGRLSAVTRDGTPIARYEYDQNGNRLAAVLWTANGETTQHAEYDERDQLLRAGSTEYQHDANGRRTAAVSQGRTTQYRYDAFGNVLSVSLPLGGIIDYGLDGEARRLTKRAAGSVVQAFLYRDRLTPIAEITQDGRLVSRFVFGQRSHSPDAILKDGAAYRVLTDALGSPRLILNAKDGTVAQRIDYDPFGQVLLDTNPGFQPFGFAGGIYDRDTGLLHFGAREYDPHSGRWTTPDPAGFGSGDTNLYAYVFNDPVNLADPFGLWSGIWPGYGPDWHHNRNGGMNCPPEMPDPYSGRPECPQEWESTGWSYEGRSATHGNYHTFRHEYGWQCVYDDTGGLVTDPENEGSFDYFPPYNPDGSLGWENIPDVAGHVLYDVIPWILWGN